jgi:hypothetical protein
MGAFSFTTDANSEEYCYAIAAAMVRDCHITRSEALRRINECWAGKSFVGDDNLTYHEMPEQIAKHVYYGKEQMWWLDERGLQSVPLEPVDTPIHKFSGRMLILGVLGHVNAEVRAWAARMLGYDRGEDPDDFINHALSRLLQYDTGARVRYWAAYALGVRSYSFSTPVISPAFRVALHDSECSVRFQAAWGLGRQKKAENVAPLVEALRDSEGCVRWRAAEALGHLGEASAIPALTDVLQDEEERVCSNALKAIRRLGGSPPA